MLGEGQHAGNALLAQRGDASGSLLSVAVRSGGYDTAEISWDYAGDNASACEVGIFLDGDLVAVVPATTTSASVASISEGAHTIDIVSRLRGEAFPDHHGNGFGSRAWVTWPASSDTTTRAYRLYRGGVLEAEISAIAVAAIQYASGGSAGRISVYGEYNGPAINAACTSEWQSDGTIDYTVCGATGTITPSKGVTYALPYGLWLQVHDELDAYSTGDAWAWRIGPKTSHLTAELAPATYQFTVSAVDAAGNESAQTSAGACRILAVPAAVTAVTTTYTDDDEITIAWQLGGDYDAINLYTNKPATGDWYETSIIEDAPAQVLAGDAEEVVLSGLPDGDLRFSLRPMQASIERPESQILKRSIPATAADLGVVLSSPTEVSAAQAAGGDVTVSWYYRYRNGDAVSAFDIIANDDGDFSAAPLLTVSVLATTGSDWPVARFSVALGQDLTAWGTVFVAVRARTATGVSSPYVQASGSVAPDATAPTLPGSPVSLPQ